MEQPPLFDNPPPEEAPAPKGLSVGDAVAQLKRIAKTLYAWASNTKVTNQPVSDFLLNTSRQILESVHSITHPELTDKALGGNPMKGPAYGLAMHFKHMHAPSKYAKTNAIADLLRQGIPPEAIRSAAAQYPDLDFYDVLKMIRHEHAGDSYEKQVRQAAKRGPHGTR